VGDLFLLQMIKAFLITGILAVIFGFISLVVLCLSDKEEVMESRSKYSTTIEKSLRRRIFQKIRSLISPEFSIFFRLKSGCVC